LLVDQLDPQAALDCPRFCLEGEGSDGQVAMEEGVAEEILADLEARQHQVRMVEGGARFLFGRGQIILRDPKSGTLTGGSDPRADGCAMVQAGLGTG